MDVARAIGLTPIPVPASPVALTARALAALPRPGFLPPALGWVTALSRPAIADCTKAKQQLGWQPRHSSIDALRATFGDTGRH